MNATLERPKQASASIYTPTPTDLVKLHFSFWVADLTRTVAFFRVLFGQEPHKWYPDYAKFELSDPPIVVSFLPNRAPRGASLNHAGLRLPNSEGLVEIQRRLEMAGYPTRREEGVECCYALQTKFWVTDPDGVLWEIYSVHEDIDHHGFVRPPGAKAVVPPGSEEQATNGVWTHTSAEPFPEKLPFADGNLNEVQLQGTFNMESCRQEVGRWLAEVRRVLKPGGKVLVRNLIGDRPHPGNVSFPGLMNKIKYVPTQTEPLDALERAGFEEIEIVTWKEVTCVDDGSGVRFRYFSVTAKR